MTMGRSEDRKRWVNASCARMCDSVSTTVGMARGCSASPPSNTQNGAAREFRSGNLVRLRSEGPLMTVRNINGNQVDCLWTDFNGQINADSFPGRAPP
jgi:uncharacterized protein YodC (DUF2158 family)